MVFPYFTSRSTFANREEDRKPVKAGSNRGGRPVFLYGGFISKISINARHCKVAFNFLRDQP